MLLSYYSDSEILNDVNLNPQGSQIFVDFLHILLKVFSRF
jgi:hypothetical protein